MPKKGTLPIFHNIRFIDRLDAFLHECRGYDDPIKDLEDFWKEYKYEVYEAYRDAKNWRDFKDIIWEARESS